MFAEDSTEGRDDVRQGRDHERQEGDNVRQSERRGREHVRQGRNHERQKGDNVRRGREDMRQASMMCAKEATMCAKYERRYLPALTVFTLHTSSLNLVN